MTRSFLFFVLFLSQTLFLKASTNNSFRDKTFGSTILSITDVYKKPIVAGSLQEVAATANTITYYITSSSTDIPKFTYTVVDSQGNSNETWYTVATTATTLKVTFTVNAHYFNRWLKLLVTSGDAAQTLIIKQKPSIDLTSTTSIAVSPSTIVNQGTEITFKGTIKNTGTATYNKYIKYILSRNDIIEFISAPTKISIGVGGSYIASFKHPTQYAIPDTYQVMFVLCLDENSTTFDRVIYPTAKINFTINPYCATPKITATSAYDAIKNTVVTKFTWERLPNSSDNYNTFYIRKKGITGWYIYENIDGSQGLTFENGLLENGTIYEYYLWTNCPTLGTSNTSTIATITTAKSKSFDLQLVSITPTPTIATVGKSMSIKVVVKNNGLGALSGATFKLLDNASATLLGSPKTNVNISAGYTSTMYFTMTAFPNLNSSSYSMAVNYIINNTNTHYYLGSSNVYQIIGSTTGLAEGLSPNTLIKQQNALTIYPNPASNNLNIDLINDTKSDNLKIELYDISGKKVLENEVFSIEGLNHYNLDISNIERGLYVLRILGKELSITEKLSIEK